LANESSIKDPNLEPILKWSVIGIVGIYVVDSIVDSLSTERHSTLDEHCGNISGLTKPKSWYAANSDSIFAAIWLSGDALFEDEEAIVNVMIQLNTYGDFLKLVCTYDVRGRYVWFLEETDLIEALVAYLSDSDKEIINTNFLEKGIDFIIP